MITLLSLLLSLVMFCGHPSDSVRTGAREIRADFHERGHFGCWPQQRDPHHRRRSHSKYWPSEIM
jgi:hypothetical protein